VIGGLEHLFADGLLGQPDPSRSVRKWILPLDRRLCSQPRSRTGCPSNLAMSSIYASCAIVLPSA
jgi:hypothetical protein